MTGSRTGEAWIGTTSSLRGTRGTHHAFDRLTNLILCEKRTLHAQPCNPRIEELGYLGSRVEHAGRIDARAPLQVGAHGELLAGTVAQTKVPLAQRATRTVVDAAIGHLEHAMLAGHRTNATKHHEAERQRRGPRQDHHLVK